MNREENVFARWSRRKLQNEKQTLQEDAASELSTRDAVQEIAGHETGDFSSEGSLSPDADQPLLTDADMPDIDTLHEGSDFSGFMSSGVSDELRNLALRKLFKAPGFNLRDGLDEYDEDYTSFEKLGDIITCDMKHQLEVEAEKLLQSEQQALVAGEAQVDDLTESEIAQLDETGEEQAEQTSLLPEDSNNREDSGYDTAKKPTDYEALENTGDST